MGNEGRPTEVTAALGSAPVAGGLNLAKAEAGVQLNARYKVLELVGVGGMGTVYRAADCLNEDQDVALKIVWGAASDPIRHEALKSEFHQMAQFRHPNLATVYDFERVPNTDDCFFTMEYVKGSDLFAATDPMDWRHTVNLVVQVCRALAFIHSRNIIHFDIKPANVLVEPSGQAKVLDFGIASSAILGSIGLRGTPSYMAPELTVSDDGVDHRVDLYSLGIVMYELLFRRTPFRERELSGLMERHRSSPIVFPEDSRAPDWLRDIIVRLTAKAASDRYPSASAVIEDINRLGDFNYEIETRETRASYVFSPHFVGREAILERARTVLAARGRGENSAAPCLLLGGQAGSGKSRLMREVRHISQLARVFFAEANCYDEAANEYDAIGQILTPLLPFAESVGAADLISAHAPELANLDPRTAVQLRKMKITAPGGRPAFRQRSKLMQSLSDFLVGLGRIAPFTIYINDLQWAPDGTIDCILHLVRELKTATPGVPVTFFGTYRSDEVEDRPISRLLEELGELGAMESLAVKPLELEEITRLLRSMLAIDNIPQLFAERLRDETSGNPLFIEEVVRSLVERGSIPLQGSTWDPSIDIANLELPKDIATVLQQRASILDGSERIVLSYLSCCPRPVLVGVLAEAIGEASAESMRLDRDAFDDTLQSLRRRQLVIVTDDGTACRLAHDRVREIFHSATSAERRLECHTGIGHALENAHKKDTSADEICDGLVYHYSRAKVWEKAARYAGVSSELAYRGGRLVDACRTLEMARDWVSHLTPAMRLQSQIDLVLLEERVCDALGDRKRQADLIAELFSAIEAKGGQNDPRLAEVYVRQGELQVALGRSDLAIDALQRALAIAESSGDRAIESRVLGSMAFLLWRQGQHAEAAQYNERALTVDRLRGDETAVCHDLINLATNLLRMQDFARVATCVEEALRISARIKSPVNQVQALHFLGNLRREEGDNDAAIASYRESVAISEQNGLVVYKLSTLGAIASTLWQMQRIDDSLVAYEEAASLARRLRFSTQLAQTLRTQGDLYNALEQTKKATDCLREAVTVFARIGDKDGEARTWLLLGKTLEKAATPNIDEIIEALEQSLKLSKETTNIPAQLEVLQECASVARAHNRNPQALAYYKAALTLAESTDDAAGQVKLLNAIGILQWRRGDHASALSHYAHALRVVRSMKDEIHEGAIRNAMGACLRSLGKFDEARACLTMAIAQNERNHESRLVADGMTLLGHVWKELKNPEAAAESYERARAVRLELRDTPNAGQLSLHLARVYISMGKSDNARQHLVQARALDIQSPGFASECETLDRELENNAANDRGGN